MWPDAAPNLWSLAPRWAPLNSVSDANFQVLEVTMQHSITASTAAGYGGDVLRTVRRRRSVAGSTETQQRDDNVRTGRYSDQP
jgi:hypothetical protein